MQKTPDNLSYLCCLAFLAIRNDAGYWTIQNLYLHFSLPSLIARSVHPVVKRVIGRDRSALHRLASHRRFVKASEKLNGAAHARAANGGAFIACVAVQHGSQLRSMGGPNICGKGLPLR